MSVLPRHRAFVRSTVAVAFAVVLLSLALGTGSPPTTPEDSRLGALVNPDPCPGAQGPHTYSGAVSVDGAAPMPNVSVSYSYDAVVITQQVGGPILSAVCTPEVGSAAATPGGTFGFSIDIVAVQNCTTPPGGVEQCTWPEGPFGPVTLAPTSPTPLGYLANVTQNGTAFHLLYYPALATVTLDPPGPSVTFSAQGIDPVRAYPWTALGGPSPAAPDYNWTLSGVGWTFASAPSGSHAKVTAAPGAGIGNLSVVASLASAAGTLITPPATLELLAVATTISTAGLNRTLLDVGQSLSALVNGSGAAGYTYSATVHPGLGGAAEPAACASSPGVGGTVTLSCSATLTYPRVGVAQPAVTVSNGVSSASWQFPDVTVDSAPSVVFLPSLPVGYTNATISVGVGVGSGTGASPYAEGCLASGSGPVQCLPSPGPTWTFVPVYPQPGHYSVLAWTVDATGVNRSAATTVRVVAPLRVDLAGNATTGAAGSAVSLAAMVSGGDLPARVWWNATGASNPVASEWIAVDGPVGATFVPSVAGFVTVSLTVVDGLGTVVGASETYTIGGGIATSVVPVVLPPASAARVGVPLAVAWQALDAVGGVAHDFASTAEIELTMAGSPRAAPGWVNASGVGPLASRLPGWFDVPETAWIGGTLNVSVTSRVSGSVQIDLVVAADLATPGDTVDVVLLPDVGHLRLFDPETVVAGHRANDTLWQVTDRFGNPATHASVVVTTSFDGSSVATNVPVLSEPDGATEVWTNFSAPDAVAGTVTVTDLAGDLLLPPTAVPGLAGPLPWWVSVLPLLLGAGVGAVARTAVLFRRRRPEPIRTDAPDDDEAALQRLAEGRATVVEVVRRAGPLDLAGLATAWESAPVPPDLADWVASLLTDGTLDATFGDDGVARFCLGEGDRTGTRVTLDLDAFDQGQVRRDAAAAEWERDDP